MTNLTFRPELNGLRAIAVLLVILSHLGMPQFKGGFIGVDIFFVISGYLIGRIITTDIYNGRFSLRAFYTKRIKRILPALLSVCLFTVLIGYYLFSPVLFNKLIVNGLSSILFFSNYFYSGNIGYFETGTQLNPLIHTWSLSVEEQFYLLFPLSLLLLLKFQHRAIPISLILLVTLLSFLFSYIEYYSGSRGYFFYSHTRIWEFLVDYLAVFIPTAQISKSLHQWLSSLGLILIMVAAIYVNDSHPYPSVYTLLPVLGTFLIISFAEEQTFVNKILTTPPFLLSV